MATIEYFKEDSDRLVVEENSITISAKTIVSVEDDFLGDWYVRDGYGEIYIDSYDEPIPFDQDDQIKFEKDDESGITKISIVRDEEESPISWAVNTDPDSKPLLRNRMIKRVVLIRVEPQE